MQCGLVVKSVRAQAKTTAILMSVYIVVNFTCHS